MMNRAFKTLRLLVIAAVVVSASLWMTRLPEARSQPSSEDGCPVHANQIRWPEKDPVWTICWTQPIDTCSEVDGAVIRLSHVLYKGKVVCDRASLPCMNV